jgi:hypothetical protein
MDSSAWVPRGSLSVIWWGPVGVVHALEGVVQEDEVPFNLFDFFWN